MALYIASDHAGFQLKSAVIAHLKSHNIDITDLGPDSDARTDYPDHAADVAKKVSNDPNARGILICGSGVGMSITANKFSGVRAALCTSVQLAKLCRQHNNANILCMGERILKEKNALMMVDTFLSTEFEGGRHAGRVEKIHSVSGC